MNTPTDEQLRPRDGRPSEDRALAECVRLMYARSGMILALMGSAAVVFAYAMPEAPAARRLLWLSLVGAATAGRVLAARRYRSRARRDDARRWAAIYTYGAACSGSAFGAAGLLFFTPGSLAGMAFLTLMLAGIAGSAIAANSLHLPAALAFAVPALAPLLTRLLMQGDRIHLAVAVFIVMFAAAMFKSGRSAALAICDSVRTAQALQESESLFRNLAERAVVGVYVIEDGRFVYVNPKMAAILGYEPQELLEVVALDTVFEGDRALVLENIRKRTRAEAAAIHYEFRALRKDGEVVVVEVFGTRTAFGGRPAIVGTLVDITARKRSEQEQIRAQKLESLGVLAGGIAHDFNNLLAAVLGSVSVAKEAASADPEQLEVLSEAESAALRARDLTKQLLTFSRGGEPVRKGIALEPVLRSAASFAVRGSSVVCRCDVAPDLWAVHADEGQLTQVVHNLVLNAVQAMSRGGTVNVTATNVPDGSRLPAALPASRYVLVCVSDDGPGISPAALERIFDPYFTTKASGSGLGLATAHSIVRRHGGHISAESQPGRGATFRIHLPAASMSPVAEPKPHRTTPRATGRIAVMDDDELVRAAATRMLTRLGYDVVLARDGRELLSVCEAARRSGSPVDAAILDLTVPGGMGGMEAVRLLGEREPAIKAIVSSGYSSDPVMADHARYGFAGVIPKPYRLDEMAAVLGRVLDMRRSMG